MQEASDLLIGIAGEHLVCADLIVKGYRAFLSDQGLPYDIILDIDTEKLLKIQVKTTRTYKAVPQRKKYIPSYLYNIKRCGKNGKGSYHKNDIDIFALVALDTKQIGYISYDNLPNTIFIRVDEFYGKYSDEIYIERAKEVFSMKSEGETNSKIANELNIDRSVVGKILNNEFFSKQGRYFRDLKLEDAINDCQNS